MEKNLDLDLAYAKLDAILKRTVHGHVSSQNT
jgi:hypothetical protein